MELFILILAILAFTVVISFVFDFSKIQISENGFKNNLILSFDIITVPFKLGYCISTENKSLNKGGKIILTLLIGIALLPLSLISSILYLCSIIVFTLLFPFYLIIEFLFVKKEQRFIILYNKNEYGKYSAFKVER